MIFVCRFYGGEELELCCTFFCCSRALRFRSVLIVGLHSCACFFFFFLNGSASAKTGVMKALAYTVRDLTPQLEGELVQPSGLMSRSLLGSQKSLTPPSRHGFGRCCVDFEAGY